MCVGGGAGADSTEGSGYEPEFHRDKPAEAHLPQIQTTANTRTTLRPNDLGKKMP